MALFQSEKELFQSEKDLFGAKNVAHFQILGLKITPLHLKSLLHPSCQVLGAAPDICTTLFNLDQGIIIKMCLLSLCLFLRKYFFY